MSNFGTLYEYTFLKSKSTQRKNIKYLQISGGSYYLYLHCFELTWNNFQLKL